MTGKTTTERQRVFRQSKLAAGLPIRALICGRRDTGAWRIVCQLVGAAVRYGEKEFKEAALKTVAKHNLRKARRI